MLLFHNRYTSKQFLYRKRQRFCVHNKILQNCYVLSCTTKHVSSFSRKTKCQLRDFFVLSCRHCIKIFEHSCTLMKKDMGALCRACHNDAHSARGAARTPAMHVIARARPSTYSEHLLYHIMS